MPSASRTIAIIIALLLAGAAVFFIWRYINDIEDQVRADQELVEVYVAAGGIPEGTQAATATAQGLIELDEIPRVNRPSGAITELEQIGGLAAVSDILPGEIIQQASFGDPASSQVDFEVPEGLQAISLEVGVPPGVAGFVQPGDSISVLAHIAAPAAAEQVIGPDGTLQPAPDATEGAEESRTQFLVQGIEVLAVGRRVVVTSEEGTPEDQVQQTESVLATVAVADEDAERLVFALSEGELYFTLLPDGYEPQSTPGRTFADLFADLNP